MGCVGSKLEELEAVSLCRDRTALLSDAISHRYALADAHAAYADSLRSVASSLHRLLEASSSVPPLPSPHLPLPPQRKGDPLPPLSPPPTPPPQPSAAGGGGGGGPHHSHSRSHSGSGSHIHFHSSDSEGDDKDDSPLHSDNGEDYGHHLHHEEAVVRLHYARNQPPPNSISYEHRPQSPEMETIHFASTSSPYPPYPNYPYSSYPDPYSYPPNPSYGYYGSSSGGFFGSYPPNLPPQPSWAAPGASSSSSSAVLKPPPPPPSPPRASTWDFLNPFDVNESYYPLYTPSRSSNEVREAEGIPDLEDEEHEVVKEAYGDRKFIPSTSNSTSGSLEEYSKEGKGKGKGKGSVGESSNGNSHYHSRSVGPVDEADVVEKNVVGEQVQQPQEEARNVAAAAAAPTNRRRFLDLSEIGSEIKIQGERAYLSAMELSGVLELGKHPYRHHRSAVYKVPTVMICVMSPSSPTGDDFLNFEEDMERNSKNLSSTLQKLYIWEKKLQDEVRAEEKMRLLHDKNCKKLKRLDERGAEAHKLDEVQKLMRKLSTKIRIAIQVVNTISTKISKLRDEELWPRIKELIQGFARMWKDMLECHRIQCEAISEAKSLDSIAYGGRLGEACLEAIMQLELELLRWIGNFSDWINAQKNYVKAMNGWLILCLHYEPEVTADGIPPYSPGRIGAPPVFVVCNYWSQALDRLSEKEVIGVMQAFAANLRCLWEQHSVGQHQQMMPNRDMDRWVKAREREAQIMHKEVDALNKKLVLVSGDNDLPGQPGEASSLHLGLKQVFEAMENFTANSLKVYEELHMQSEEEGANVGKC